VRHACALISTLFVQPLRHDEKSGHRLTALMEWNQGRMKGGGSPRLTILASVLSKRWNTSRGDT
jgi:hypothetical protein